MEVNYNRKFEDLYNRLNNLLVNVTNTNENKSLISYYEQIVPEKISSQLKTMRKFRNSINGHGVSVDGKMPTAPNEWIIFLNGQIKYIESHKELINKKLSKKLNYYSKNNKTTSKKVTYEKLKLYSLNECINFIGDCFKKNKKCNYSLVRDYINDSKDFKNVNKIIKYILNSNQQNIDKEIALFLNEVRLVVADMNIKSKRVGLFNKKIIYEPENSDWLKYFDSDDFAEILEYCRDYDIDLKIYSY